MNEQTYFIRAISRIENVEVIPNLEITLPLDIYTNCLVKIATSNIVFSHITEETYKNSKNDAEKNHVYLEVSYSIEPSTKIKETFNDILLKEKYPFEEKYEIPANEMCIYPLNFYKNFLIDFVIKTEKEITNLLDSVFQILRWQNEHLNKKNTRLVNNTGFQISLDRINWLPLPNTNKYILQSIQQKYLDSNDFKLDSINNLIANNISEPPYHQILREARSLLNSTVEASTRSSLIFSVLAIEITVKEVISRLSPNSTWLIDNLSSPPIDKLLSEFIPELVESQYNVPSELIPELKKIIFNRNQIIHKRNFVIDHRTSNTAFDVASKIVEWAESTLKAKSLLYL